MRPPEPRRRPSRRSCEPAGVCDFPIDPTRDARDAAVIWDLETDPGLIALVAPCDTACGPPTAGDTPQGMDDHQHASGCVIVGAGRDAIAVLLPKGHRLDPSLCALVLMDAHLTDRIEALMRLSAHMRTASMPPDRRITLQQRRRLRHMLQAGDARRAGATYREIATSLFGAVRVAAAPWKTSSLRDTVIALVEDARLMVEGDYRKLLYRRRRCTSPR
ncbi:Protein of unknown function DUF2285 [Ancylobacter novellus DSM 506]|uniref:T6SS Transcription factor RovC-like DNA binding domain-containing protein n=2 Tax=Ancylobacter novellus TaxID=921 RepID=D7A6G2_ANCN5|nr:Protein of unknown function DUF2285 [Ancylobacter novellus DSM 506]